MKGEGIVRLLEAILIIAVLVPILVVLYPIHWIKQKVIE